jgi:signal transduction histidine kinase
MDSPAEILGEPKDIHALITNLISNAIEACNADQDDQKAHNVVIRVFQDKHTAVLAVEDNGGGMDPATRNALFHEIVSTKGSAGTGLGLVTSHKVATEHGGNIAVQSEIGRGSVFTVRLPARPKNASSA